MKMMFFFYERNNRLVINISQLNIDSNESGLWFMVFNATFNNISVILWWSVLLVEETRVHRENHRPVASH